MSINLFESKRFWVMLFLVPLSIFSMWHQLETIHLVRNYEYKNVGENVFYLKHSLNMNSFSNTCEDIHQQKYAPNTNVQFSNNNYNFTYQCKHQRNRYQWTVINTELKLLFTDKLSTNPLGCEDKLDNIYPLGYNLQTDYKYTCSFKNNTYYWLIK
jgi:hypothetical protein